MKRFLLLFLAVPALAVTDPLSSQFKPTIDKTPSDYYTSFGTITVTDSLYKVFQGSVAPGNYRWFADTSAYMMQNEMLSFQVHVTPSVNVTSLTVTVSSLTNTQTNTVVSTMTDIFQYREFYMNISTPSSIGSSYYNFRAFMPDQLIPAYEPYYKQTTNAWPVAVTAGKTQSAWFDIHMPSAAPSGYYQGTITVSSGSTVISTMPVVVGVWAWSMPSTTTLGSEMSGFEYDGMCDVYYGGETNCGNYPGGAGGSDHANTVSWIDGAAQLLDNRYGIYLPANIFPGSGSFTIYVSSIGPLLNGGNVGNAVQTILPGAALSRVGDVQNNAFNAATWQNFESTFTNQGWVSRLNAKICDEPPGGCTWAQLISSGTATRSFSTPIIPNMVTVDSASADSNGALYVIDWITPIINSLDSDSSGNHRADYNHFLSLSSGTPRHIGSYQDCESAGNNACANGTIGDSHGHWPTRHIDSYPVANRAFETWAFKNSLAYEHYFDTDYCDANNCPTSINPWVSVYAFGANGDGTMMYASTQTYVTTSKGFPIWIPSIRLKHVRDGMQDYEYENYLTNQGQGTLVNTQIATWMTSGNNFNTDPVTFQNARFTMGQAIHQLTYPASGVPTSSSHQWQGGIQVQGGAQFH